MTPEATEYAKAMITAKALRIAIESGQMSVNEIRIVMIQFDGYTDLATELCKKMEQPPTARTATPTTDEGK